MGVVRIDDKLQKKIQNLINKAENRYKYPSMSIFINCVLAQELDKIEKGGNKK